MSGAASPPAALPTLFSPLALRGVTLANRIVSTAHGTNLALDGLPGERLAAYLEARAAGGVGLLITESLAVHESATNAPNVIQLWKPGAVDGLRAIAERAHAHGAKIFGQLSHPGGMWAPFICGTTRMRWGASAVANPLTGDAPHASTAREIAVLVDAFARGARVLVEAGFDGAELHAAHGALFEQFLSPLSNRRTDDYRQERGDRLLLEVVEAVREHAGPAFVVGARISAMESIEGGLTLDAMKAIVGSWPSGALDYLNVCLLGLDAVPTVYVPRAHYSYLATAMRAVFRGPLLFAGRVTSGDVAERLLASGAADLVGMTRATICDPDLPRKLLTGRSAQIRPCISCNEGCIGNYGRAQPIACAVNPATGREAEPPAPARGAQKRAVVVGGGPAGLEAALTLARSGHAVTLFERAESLGGQLRVAAQAPMREALLDLVAFYARELEALGVRVLLGHEATRERVDALGPDCVVLATGGEPAPTDLAHDAGTDVVSAREVLRGREVGARVAVVATDGGMEGLSAADFLAARGHAVVLLATGQPGERADRRTVAGVLARLREAGVNIRAATQARSFVGDRLLAVALATGVEEAHEVDSVVVAAGSRPHDELARSLAGSDRAVLVVGEAGTASGWLAVTRDAYDKTRLV